MADATDGDPDEELATAVDELADVLRELRGELRPGRRGPFGLPAPPSPGELLRFTDEHAIPFAIAVLEANIRTLELIQGTIRLASSGKAAGEEASQAGKRAASLGRSTLRRLDDVLSDLEAAANDGALPRQEAAREVLEEARALRAEVDDALATRVDDGESMADEEWPSGDGSVIDVHDDERANGDDRTDVDVEGELRSIKQELGKLDEPRDADGTAADETGPADAENDGENESNGAENGAEDGADGT